VSEQRPPDPGEEPDGVPTRPQPRVPGPPDQPTQVQPSLPRRIQGPTPPADQPPWTGQPVYGQPPPPYAGPPPGWGGPLPPGPGGPGGPGGRPPGDDRSALPWILAAVVVVVVAIILAVILLRSGSKGTATTTDTTTSIVSSSSTAPATTAAPATTTPPTTAPPTTPSTSPPTTTPPTTTPPTTAPPVTPPLSSGNGTGDGNLGSFTASGPWTLQYSYDCSNLGQGQASDFAINILDPDGKPDATNTGVKTTGSGGGPNTNREPQGGTFSLQIVTKCMWTVMAVGSS
jgi:hypothetical protein